MFSRAVARAATSVRTATATLRTTVAPGTQRGFACVAETTSVPVERPSGSELRKLFVHAAVPFVAFGFVDNSVLIHAGDMIDNTFGVYFGLPTLAAAAMGQVFSDTSGVLFGSTIEAVCTKLGLPIPRITPQQHMLPITKLTKTAGSVIGVVTGCCIGMLNLLIIDVGAKERAEKEAKMQTMFETVLKDAHKVMECDGASLFMIDKESKELWTKSASNDVTIRLPMDKGIVGKVVLSGKLMNIKDAYAHPDFSTLSDQQNNYKTHTIITAPVLHSETGEVLAAIQLVNKKNKKGVIKGSFTKEDEKLVQMLCAHVAVFIETVTD